METLTQETVAAIADLLFDVEERIFSQSGSVDRTVFGVRTEQGKIAEIHRVDFDSDVGTVFDDPVPSLVRRLRDEYPVVISIAEEWKAPRAAKPAADCVAQEQLLFVIYAPRQTYTMTCAVERHPNRLVKGSLEAAGAVNPLSNEEGSATRH